MEINIECPWCNQHYSVDESFIGQNVECAVCEKQFIVKKPDDPASASENEPASPSSLQEETDTPDVSQDCTPDNEPSMPDQDMLKELEARRAELFHRSLDYGSLRGIGGIIFWLLFVCLFFATIYYLAGD